MARGKKKVVEAPVTYILTDKEGHKHVTQDPLSGAQALVEAGNKYSDITARKMDKFYKLEVRMVPKEEAASSLPDILVFQPAEGKAVQIAGKLSEVAGQLDKTRPIYSEGDEILHFAQQVVSAEGAVGGETAAAPAKKHRGRPRKVAAPVAA